MWREVVTGVAKGAGPQFGVEINGGVGIENAAA